MVFLNRSKWKIPFSFQKPLRKTKTKLKKNGDFYSKLPFDKIDLVS